MMPKVFRWNLFLLKILIMNFLRVFLSGFYHKKTCQNDKVFIKLKMKEKNLCYLSLQMNDREFPSFGGGVRIERILTGWSKESTTK
jgi:hypothetical protein